MNKMIINKKRVEWIRIIYVNKVSMIKNGDYDISE